MVLPVPRNHRGRARLGLLPLSEAERGRREAFHGEDALVEYIGRLSAGDQHRQSPLTRQSDS